MMQKWNLSSCFRQVPSQLTTYINPGVYRPLLVCMALLVTTSVQGTMSVETDNDPVLREVRYQKQKLKLKSVIIGNSILLRINERKLKNYQLKIQAMEDSQRELDQIVKTLLPLARKLKYYQDQASYYANNITWANWWRYGLKMVHYHWLANELQKEMVLPLAKYEQAKENVKTLQEFLEWNDDDIHDAKEYREKIIKIKGQIETSRSMLEQIERQIAELTILIQDPLNEERINPNKLKDNYYQVEVIPNNQGDILKLTDNTYKTFYWSSDEKQTYYKHNPRFVDSRYAFAFQATESIQAIFAELEQKIKEYHESSLLHISLPSKYKENLDCYSEFPNSAAATTCKKYKDVQERIEPQTISSVVEYLKEKAGIEFVVASNEFSKASDHSDSEYCRVTGPDINLPPRKPSEREFIEKMREEGREVICFTIESNNRFDDFFKHWAKKEQKASGQLISKKITDTVIVSLDCHPTDLTVKLSEEFTLKNHELKFSNNDSLIEYEEYWELDEVDKIECSHNSSKVTVFVAVEKGEGKTDFPLAAFHLNHEIERYYEIPPWGSLMGHSVEDRGRMFDRSSIEHVEIDTTSTKIMSHMFVGAKKIDEGNFKYWDTSNVFSMYRMFYSATNFNQPIGDWDISGLNNWLFFNCMFQDADAFIAQNFDSFWSAKKEEFEKKGVTKKHLTCAR